MPKVLKSSHSLIRRLLISFLVFFSQFSILVLQAAKRSGMEISDSVVACISDLAFKFTGLFALETWSNKQCQAFPKLQVTELSKLSSSDLISISRELGI
ncbi:hypothetical protein RchiOBHm_Chr6g0290021 [Rosa chinensis]|uniref:Uncharacterized protein n=1 Tax=Rosa chinensis TaxID=74649 RepID=A0A2P6PVR6_ROSCH|nr:hypothetical protein RchiOBHm_Chr6g0290021 [Rosa chinensis]